MRRFIRRTLPLTLFLATHAFAETIAVGAFNEGSLEGWTVKEFAGATEYQILPIDSVPGSKRVLQAVSSASASGLVREISIDLEKTPYLNWSWRIEDVLPVSDERSKAGDDYPARVYVVVSGGWAFWNTKSLNYVWANRLPVGTQWPNAYTGQARMLALKSGPEQSNQWQSERRNIREDLQQAFGEDIRHIDAVAIMTDTDQTGATVRAWYGDMWFSSE